MANSQTEPLGPFKFKVISKYAPTELGDTVPLLLVKGDEESLAQYTELNALANDFDMDSNVYLNAKAIFEGTNPPAVVMVKTYVSQDSYVSPTGISLEPASLIGAANTTANVVATVMPTTATSKVISVSSSNVAVATASTNADGSVTVAMKSPGTAKITFATGVQGEIKAVLPVTVSSSIVPVTGITVDPTTLTGEVGESGQLAATVMPDNATNKGFEMSSSDEAVASVDESGKVTYLAPGTSTITLTTVDGHYTANTTVTVNEPVVAVTGVSLDNTTLAGKVGKTAKLTATVSPANAANSAVSFTSSDDTIATVTDDGTVTYVKAGEATITVTTTDGNKTATATVTVTDAE
ncbi:hypothetical protein [Lactobacillus hokkaidonensis JCM 18461] [Lactiplantibacillus mudanjiangensis]|nr:hypothetical protein [Lactobacillus hokkaidonensis JCM 18461] [Lactiplantibacillus mudanjiangensis]